MADEDREQREAEEAILKLGEKQSKRRKEQWQSEEAQAILKQIIIALRNQEEWQHLVQQISFTDYLSNGSLNRAPFSDVELLGISLPEAELDDVDFSNANLEGSDFRGAYLGKANFSGANLKNCIFDGAYLLKTNFEGSNLSHASLKNVRLLGANLDRADLSYANLKGAILHGVSKVDTFWDNTSLKDTSISEYPKEDEAE